MNDTTKLLPKTLANLSHNLELLRKDHNMVNKIVNKIKQQKENKQWKTNN